MDYLFLSRQTLDGFCQVTSHGLFVFISLNAGCILSGNFTWIVCFYLVKRWILSGNFTWIICFYLVKAGWILSGYFTWIICFHLVKCWMDSVRLLHMDYLFLSRQTLDGFCQVTSRSHVLFVFISSNAGWILSGNFTWIICFYLVKRWMDSVR